MKRRNVSMNLGFVVLLVSIMGLLTGCPNPKQEQSLMQIQSQISVLSNEVRDSFSKTEEDQVELYRQLNEDLRLLQQNQADSVVINDQLTTSLIAIEAKLDEYNARMAKLSERLDLTENALTERITLLSDQVSDIRRETTITPGSPQPVAPAPVGQATSEPASSQEILDPEASQFYHEAYLAYVNGDFDTAIAGFQKYMELYPDTELVDIAQFWTAESFFSIGEYETALKEYDKLINQYPGSDKIPEAFLSKADAFLKLDRQIEAISHLKYVVNQFPNTVAAREAAERLQMLGE